MSDKPTDPNGRQVVPQPHGGALRPFPKGQSGNPGGQSRERLALESAIERNEIPKVLALLNALYERGLEGDVGAANAWLNRVVGPVSDDDTITAKAEKMLRALLEEAEAEARKNRNAIDVEVK